MDLLKVYSNHADQVERFRSLLALPRSRQPDPSASSAKRPQHRLADDEVADLVAEYHAGGKVKELATRFGIHRATVHNILEREGVLRPRGIQPDELPEAIRLYESGWTTARLATKYQVAQSTVWKTLRTAGVVLRPRGGCHGQ